MSSKQFRRLKPEEVAKIGRLAELPLQKSEVKRYQKQLSKIFDYIDLIAEMETGKVTETSHATGRENVFRKDKTGRPKPLSQEEALSGAQKKKDGFFLTKSVFE